ncbi:hypothetical protein C0993_012482 [Termitomyces sp. T159_Od127]|nr:hypothetical protein C0993_012482 [Termitomyces sp. T159_Od127]
MHSISVSLLLAIASALSAVSRKDETSAFIEAGQHVIWSYPGFTPPQSLYDAISAGHVAGIIFFEENITTNISNVITSLKTANEASPTKLPLLLMTDQEGGAVRRLEGEPVQNARQMCGNGTAAAGGIGAGENLRSVGMNMNLAPVLDVYRVSGNFIDEYGRSFSSNATAVGICGVDFMEAQRTTGVLSTVKHFPGLGTANVDQNTDLTVVNLNVTLSEIRSIDEQPYSAAITAGAELVMASRAIYPALDPISPAEPFGSYGDRAVMASQARRDLIMASARDITQGSDIVTALADALDNGTLDTEAFTNATKRIEKLRMSLA